MQLVVVVVTDIGDKTERWLMNGKKKEE